MHEATGPQDTHARSAHAWHRENLATSMVIPAMVTDVDEVEVVVAHKERTTQRVGDVFLKIDADQTRIEVEVEAMAMAPVPEILWRKPPVLALTALPGTAPDRLGEPSPASPAATGSQQDCPTLPASCVEGRRPRRNHVFGSCSGLCIGRAGRARELLALKVGVRGALPP
ncbi:hypothetical protein AB0K48_26840 [Nonomuraea sp. NPDC055795]